MTDEPSGTTVQIPDIFNIKPDADSVELAQQAASQSAAIRGETKRMADDMGEFPELGDAISDCPSIYNAKGKLELTESQAELLDADAGDVVSWLVTRNGTVYISKPSSSNTQEINSKRSLELLATFAVIAEDIKAQAVEQVIESAVEVAEDFDELADLLE